jgi:hypothetical protein
VSLFLQVIVVFVTVPIKIYSVLSKSLDNEETFFEQEQPNTVALKNSIKIIITTTTVWSQLNVIFYLK